MVGTIAFVVDLVSWHHSLVGNIVYASPPTRIELYSETSTLAAIVDIGLVASVVL